MSKSKTYYRRHLPHYQPSDATFFVTFRLAGSLPVSIVERLRQEREVFERRLAGMTDQRQKREDYHAHQQAYFERFDSVLDGDETGPHWLQQSEIAQLVFDAMKYRDGKEYDLLTCCIMPNYLHMLLNLVGLDSISTEKGVQVSRAEARPTEIIQVGRAEARPTEAALTSILRLLKGATARECNKVLGRTGPSWQHESYDRVVRDGIELERLLWYLLFNPVKAGLVDSWERWPWTYCRPGLL
jgi:REP element-mobilizing transposase RayT